MNLANLRYGNGACCHHPEPVEVHLNPSDRELLRLSGVCFRRDERVIRFLTFRLDKYAAQYAAKRRSLKGTKAIETAEHVEEAKED